MTGKYSRRKFCKSTLLAGASSVVAPTIWAKKKIKLRVLGTHATLQEALRRQAMTDLGIEIEFEPKGDAAVLHQASTQPQSFDIYEQWTNSINVLWNARTIQPIDVSRIRYWKEINPLTKEGKLTANARYGKGDAPYKILYVQKDKELGSRPSGSVSFLPYVHNADSYGYNSAVIPQGIPYETESWTWLLDEQYRGRTALVNAPTIGIFDAALAAEGAGLMGFKDIGNMTRKEIDQLFNILIKLKEQGHFRGVWTSIPQSADYMLNEGVVVESMFSPGVSIVRGQGVPCIYAAPKEGYRAWHGVMCLSAATNGAQKDAAYEYMNWWLSGWAGAYIAKQGYYISTPHLSKPFLSEAEWDYWYEGQEAREDLKNPSGEVVAKKGELRTGGSYQKRFSNIAVWNTVMDEYEYSLMRWGEFLRT